MNKWLSLGLTGLAGLLIGSFSMRACDQEAAKQYLVQEGGQVWIYNPISGTAFRNDGMDHYRFMEFNENSKPLFVRSVLPLLPRKETTRDFMFDYAHVTEYDADGNIKLEQ